jgi:flagellar biogenesis protein FliO
MKKTVTNTNTKLKMLLSICLLCFILGMMNLTVLVKDSDGQISSLKTSPNSKIEEVSNKHPEANTDIAATTTFIDSEEDFFLQDYESIINQTEKETQGEENSRSLLLKASTSFILVIITIYLSINGLNWLKRRYPSHGYGSKVSVVETTPLAPGRTLHLVSVDGRQILIGATDHQVTFLSEINPTEQAITEATSTFTEILSKTPSPQEIRNDWQSSFEKVRYVISQIQNVETCEQNENKE